MCNIGFRIRSGETDAKEWTDKRGGKLNTKTIKKSLYYTLPNANFHDEIT